MEASCVATSCGSFQSAPNPKPKPGRATSARRPRSISDARGASRPARLSRATRGRARRRALPATLEQKRSPIVLTERRDHLEYLAEQLRGFARHVVVLKGERGAKERRAVAAQLAAIPLEEERLVLAIGRYIGEGFDDARLDTRLLAMPIALARFRMSRR